MTATTENHADRMRRAARQAGQASLDGVVLTPGADLRYLTGYQPPAATERLTMLVIPVEGEPTLVVPRLERPDEQSLPANGAVSIVDWSDGEDPYQVAARLLDASGRYAISDSAWALHVLGLQSACPASRWHSMATALPMLRAIKEPEEVERLRRAGAAADAAFERICRARFSGRSEREVGDELATLVREAGHDTVEFWIVGSGPNGAVPHHGASDRIIEDGDMVVLDFGGWLNGYASDTSRTVHVGTPSDEELAVYEAVQRAQQAAFECARPGVACSEIDEAARAVITDAGYGEYFIHRTGHGIGMEMHEPPYMVAGERQLLEPGMCFSIEPGIYLPGKFGVRIEDIVTVTQDGAERLNNSSRDLQLVS